MYISHTIKTELIDENGNIRATYSGDNPNPEQVEKDINSLGQVELAIGMDWREMTVILTSKKSVIGLVSLSCFTLISVGVTGCGTNNLVSNQMVNMSMNSTNSLQLMATVKMTIPKETKAGKTNQFSVLVTQQGKHLNQVDDVMFEIWKDSRKSKHEIIHAKRTGDGIYSIEYSFKDAGTYNVMYHVVAGGNMIMTGPQKIIVMK